MKKFKTFLKENVEPEQGYLDDLGRPCVVVEKYRHKAVHESEDTPHDKTDTEWFHHNENKHVGWDTHDIGKALHAAQGIRGHDNSPEHHELRKYTDTSHTLNRALLGEHRAGRPAPTFVGNHSVTTMDAAVNRHSLKHPLNVYSGVSFHPDEIASKHPERHMHFPAYTSSSIQKHVAESFATPKFSDPTDF